MPCARHVIGRHIFLEQWQGTVETGIELHRQRDQVDHGRRTEADDCCRDHDSHATRQAGQNEQKGRGHHQQRTQLLRPHRYAHHARAGRQWRIAFMMLNGVSDFVSRHGHRRQRTACVIFM